MGREELDALRLQWEDSIVKDIKKTWSEKMVECGNGQE